MRAAVFDLDGTLLPGTSAERLFAPYLVRRGVLGPRQLTAVAVTAATMPFRGRTVALRRNKRYLTGLEVAVVRGHASDFVAEVLRPRLSPLLLEAMHGLREAGCLPCLLTGTLDVLAEAVATSLGMVDALGTGLEVRGGHYTGRIGGTHYFGDAKVSGLETLATRHDLDLTASWGFADHGTDVPFLESLGYPVAVDPDARLRREARKKGWPVVVHSPGSAPDGSLHEILHEGNLEMVEVQRLGTADRAGTSRGG